MGSFALSSPSQVLTFAFMAAYTTYIYCSLSMIRDPNHCSEFNLCYIMSIQDVVLMSFDNYIFSVLSAKKSWFHCFIFGADNDTSAPSILFKLASPYLLHALAMAWEFTNVTLRFLPSILHPLLKSLEALILLAFCE